MPRQQAPTVLIVEDDPATAALEKRHLERAGYSADSAATAAEALKQLGRRRYELLVLDYRLPEGTDGLAFYHRLQEGGHDLPVILVTGFSDEATVIRMANDYIALLRTALASVDTPIGELLG